MDPLDTTSEFIIVKTPFGDRKKRNPNYGNNSGLNSIAELEKNRQLRNDAMISNLQADSSGFGNHGGKKSKKSRKSRKSKRSRRSRRSKRSRRY
jgi:hypothetical protein